MPEPIRNFGPPRDRRQHRRIVTLKNTAKLFVVLLVIFALISIASEYMGRSRPGQHGRLYEKRLDPALERLPTPPPPVVVEEQKVSTDQIAANPFLVESGARSQYLGVDPLSPAVDSAKTIVQPPLANAPRLDGGTFYDSDGNVIGSPPKTESQAKVPPLKHDEHQKVVITQGPNGVELHVVPNR
ncbi:MAG: hypothetical protein ABI718_06935 [Acidobacteriota bacterium]